MSRQDQELDHPKDRYSDGDECLPHGVGGSSHPLRDGELVGPRGAIQDFEPTPVVVLLQYAQVQFSNQGLRRGSVNDGPRPGQGNQGEDLLLSA